MELVVLGGLSKVISVLMRVPPVFLLDELFKTNINIGSLSWLEGTFSTGGFLVLMLKTVLLLTGFIVAVMIICLDTDQLLTMYVYVVYILCIYFSYWLNSDTVKRIAENDFRDITWIYDTDVIKYISSIILSTLMIQIFLSSLFRWIYRRSVHLSLFRIALISFISPPVLSLFPFPHFVLARMSLLFSMLPLSVLVSIIFSLTPSMLSNLRISWRHCKTHVLGFGLASFIELQWNRINLPWVLRVFWLLRIVEYLVIYLKCISTIPVENLRTEKHFEAIALNNSVNGTFLKGLKSLYIVGSLNKTNEENPIQGLSIGLGHMFIWLLVTGCENSIAVLGMTSIVSYCCQLIGRLCRWILMTDEDEKNFATVSGFLFSILSLQTGLTSLEPEKRYIRLYRNFYLLFTAILHIVHGMLNGLLMSLGASHSTVLHRHLRAIAVGIFLLIYPVVQLVYIWNHHELSTWLLAVSAFSVEVVFKVTVTLIVYFLFVLDSCRSTFWERLDDYVYYIRSIGSSMEFCFGIFLFFNGAWILLFESGGAIRAVMMCIHAYFNIWCEAKNGWATFMKRRTAVQKIDTLRDASPLQLRRLEDVCSICYQQMKTAKITACRHFFHAVCLRKWLYLQDHCPLCHTILYKQETTSTVPIFDHLQGEYVHHQLDHDDSSDDEMLRGDN